MTPEIYSALTRLFLKSNTAQMPAAFERGLVAFFSTFEVSGIRIIAGKPPAQPDLDWARYAARGSRPTWLNKFICPRLRAGNSAMDVMFVTLLEVTDRKSTRLNSSHL